MVGRLGQEWLGLGRKPRPKAFSSPLAGKEAHSSLSTVLPGSTRLRDRVAHRGANCGEWEVWNKDGRVKQWDQTRCLPPILLHPRGSPQGPPLLFPSGSHLLAQVLGPSMLLPISIQPKPHCPGSRKAQISSECDLCPLVVRHCPGLVVTRSARTH